MISPGVGASGLRWRLAGFSQAHFSEHEPMRCVALRSDETEAEIGDTENVGLTPRTLYAKSGQLSIACQVFGRGLQDLVLVPSFVSHLEVAMELPNLARVAARLGSFARVITFDKRGTGLSERTLGLPTLAERMDDIRAVMDATESERAAIVGISEGGGAAAMFAACHPERVSALVLWLAALGPPLVARSEQTKAMVAFLDGYIGEHWGDGSATRLLMGAGAPDVPAVDELLSRFERNAATPAAAQAVLRRSSRDYQKSGNSLRWRGLPSSLDFALGANPRKSQETPDLARSGRPAVAASSGGRE
jgi:pimeloyl-ACP methyl ester carboxylesterase